MPTAPPGFARRLFLALHRPAWTAVFLGLLILSAVVLRARLGYDTSARYFTQSSLSRWLRLQPYPPVGTPPGADFYAVKGADGSWKAVVDPDRSANAVAQAIAADPPAVVLLAPWFDDRAQGFYDPVRRRTVRTLGATRADGKPLPAEELPGLIRDLEGTPFTTMVKSDRDLGPWFFADGMATQSRLEFRPQAIANNTFAAVATLGFLWSLGWIPRARARALRRKRFAARLCPQCAYDRRSTPPEAPCPECGSPFQVDP